MRLVLMMRTTVATGGPQNRQIPVICRLLRPCDNVCMRVIPVIDLLGGHVVRGMGGRRDEYRPIQSSLVPGSEPALVATVLKERFQLPRMYVADLDSIMGGMRDVSSWRVIAAAGWELTIDAGLRTADEVVSLAEMLRKEFRTGEFVIGLESFRSLADLAELARSRSVDMNQAVFSLDMKAGVPLTQDPDWRGASPLELMSEVHCCGIRRVIVLDLADVGSGQGTSTLPFVGQFRAHFPELEIIAGGGVRGLADLQQLKTVGTNAALVASALHDGRLTPAEVHSLNH